jgi:hypothetical protein
MVFDSERFLLVRYRRFHERVEVGDGSKKRLSGYFLPLMWDADRESRQGSGEESCEES